MLVSMREGAARTPGPGLRQFQSFGPLLGEACAPTKHWSEKNAYLRHIIYNELGATMTHTRATSTYGYHPIYGN